MAPLGKGDKNPSPFGRCSHSLDYMFPESMPHSMIMCFVLTLWIFKKLVILQVVTASDNCELIPLTTQMYLFSAFASSYKKSLPYLVRSLQSPQQFPRCQADAHLGMHTPLSSLQRLCFLRLANSTPANLNILNAGDSNMERFVHSSL